MVGPIKHPVGQRERGFTLLELLVVIVLIGLGASLAPFLISGGSGMELRTAARGVARDLRKFHQQAIRRQVGVSIQVDTSDGRTTIDADTRALMLPAGMTLTYRHGHAGIVDQPIDRLMFFADGSSSGGELVLKRGTDSTAITIAELDGQVSTNE